MCINFFFEPHGFDRNPLKSRKSNVSSIALIQLQIPFAKFCPVFGWYTTQPLLGDWGIRETPLRFLLIYLSRHLDQETNEDKRFGGGGATRPLPRDGGAEKLHRPNSQATLPRSRPDVKGRIGAKIARRKVSDAGQSRS